ncbi:MAG: hypothetical protein L0Y54_18830 [Sporichthyaceae bacterium]|nr:hypothetical protein [Sporichthyaceae bacterium]
MTVYMSTAARHGLDKLQGVLDAHPVSSGTGRCVICGVEVCPSRLEALQALAALQQLPRRAPGATRPELIGARRVVVGRG